MNTDDLFMMFLPDSGGAEVYGSTSVGADGGYLIPTEYKTNLSHVDMAGRIRRVREDELLLIMLGIIDV